MSDEWWIFMVDLVVPYAMAGRWEGTDFMPFDGLVTPGLEECFSAMTWHAYGQGHYGTLGHFSLRTPPERFDEYFVWLKKHVPFSPFAKLFLVGGKMRQSKGAIDELEERLHKEGFPKAQKDVLGSHRRDTRLTRDGKVEIVYYQQHLANRDEVEYVCVGTKVLE